MLVDLPQLASRQFRFSFCSKEQTRKLTVDLQLPLQTSFEEFVCRLVNVHNIPCYAVDSLNSELDQFVREEMTKLFDEASAVNLAKLDNFADSEIADIANTFADKYALNDCRYNKNNNVLDNEVFISIYQCLVESPALEPLLKLEQSYALTCAELISRRDTVLISLRHQQQNEMENVVQNIGKLYEESDVSRLSAHHIEVIELSQTKWNSEITALKESQIKEFRQWVMAVYEDLQNLDGESTILQRSKATNDSESRTRSRSLSFSIADLVEESFTVHLGAQLKSTHNLRLTSCDVLELCRYSEPHGGLHPMRMHMALSLYTNNLTGLVLLVDGRINCYHGIKNEFSRICEEATELHFPSLNVQLEAIQAEVVNANRCKQEELVGETSSSSSCGSSFSCDSSRLQAGDFYVTNHSNLSNAHVVFHLVVDDSVRKDSMSSHHPVILGIKNILKTASRSDVSSVTIPLLLTHEMCDEMTFQWCLKRAELIIKCIKGFLIDISTWGAVDIQFLLPRGISEELFNELRSILPSICRESNTLILSD